MSYLHANISEVEDADFQQMIDELYHCVAWPRDDQQISTLFYLLSAIKVQDAKALTTEHLPASGILTTKIGKLPQGVIYDLCCELAGFKGTHIESLDRKSVLTLLKSYSPKPPRQKKIGRVTDWHQRTTRVIDRRREHGHL